VPSHPVARALLESAGVPIAAPSANRFTELSPTAAVHVLQRLAERASLLLDGGPASVGIESVVVDLSQEDPILLRPGSIPRERIEAVLGKSLSLPAVYAQDAARPAPGMIARHYSPRAEVVLVPSGDAETAETRMKESVDSGLRAAAVVYSITRSGPGWHRLPSDPLGYARDLYATLHRLDAEGYERVVIEEVPAADEWAGVSDRLRRAAAYRE
jgi:L-threonylcarbamoyladenylate synthase